MSKKLKLSQLVDNDASAKDNVRIKSKGNDLDGATWTRYSISVWNDISKSPSEKRAQHPAMFPKSLVARLIECFTTRDDKLVLDPFLGSGSTIVAADELEKTGVGIDISEEYITLTKQRLMQSRLFGKTSNTRL